MRSEVIVPEVGEVGGEVTFVGWVAEDGAQVAVGDPLFEVDTAKAVLVVEAFAAGRLSRLDIPSGTVVEPHQVVGTINDAPGTEGDAPAAASTGSAASAGSAASVSPRARQLARRLGIPLDGVIGSGPGGRIIEADIEAAAPRRHVPDHPGSGRSRSLTIPTSAAIEPIDITDRLGQLVRPTDGLLWLSTPHTTSALIICEGDPEMLEDIVTMAHGLLAPFEPFRHRRNDNPNGRAHLMSSVMGTQLIVACAGGQLALGTWQRIVFVELDGPKERVVRVTGLAAAV